MASPMTETSHRRINALVAVICVGLVVAKVSGKSMGAQASRTSDAVISCESHICAAFYEKSLHVLCSFVKSSHHTTCIERAFFLCGLQSEYVELAQREMLFGRGVSPSIRARMELLAQATASKNEVHD
jgi:hypothetical protein